MDNHFSDDRISSDAINQTGPQAGAHSHICAHGGDIYTAETDLGIDRSALLDFSANIMPAEIDCNIKNAIIEAIDNCRYYPDPQQRRLRQALAAHHELKPDQIVCGNGAADLIYRTMHSLKPSRAYLPVPSFSEYERALREVDSEINYWHLSADNDFKIDEKMLTWLEELESQAISSEASRHGCSVLVICQPNNPTGLLIAPDTLGKVIERCIALDIYLFIDECFLDFLGPIEGELFSSMEKLRQYNFHESRLMLLRSMTKYYSLPGLRAGYLCTDSKLAAKILSSGQPWSVGTLTEAAVLSIINRDRSFQIELADKVEKWLSTEKPLLEQALRDCGFTVWSGAANYIFFRAIDLPNVDLLLRARGIIIRSCANYIGLDQTYFRIAVLRPEENKQFILTLREISF